VAWRLQIAHENVLEFGLAAALAWIAISLYFFRRRIWLRDRSRLDALAITGLKYYCAELERRRKHLRNEWLWHGPLLLASIILIAVLTGKANIAFQPLRNVIPLFGLLAGWIAFGIWRRRLQANGIQREIDEVVQLAAGEPSDKSNGGSRDEAR
jgi:uncharacterized membrane protein YciS (DUF1049 family)